MSFCFFFLQIFFRNLNATVHSDTRIYWNLQKCLTFHLIWIIYKEFKKCFQKNVFRYSAGSFFLFFFAQFSYVLFHLLHLTFSHWPCIYFPVLLMHHNLKSECRASSLNKTYCKIVTNFLVFFLFVFSCFAGSLCSFFSFLYNSIYRIFSTSFSFGFVFFTNVFALIN